MIDAVNTVTVQNSVPRPVSQGTAPAIPVASSAPSIVWRLVTDDQTNRLLIETVSASGQVVSQWPTQSQLAAFSQAAALSSQAAATFDQQQAQQYVQWLGLSPSSSPSTASAGGNAGAPVQAPVPTPTVTLPSVPATPQAVSTATVAYGSNAGSGGGQGASTQSVVA